MTTEDTTRKASLDDWKKSPFLTVDEALNLYLEIVPYEQGAFRFDYGGKMPSKAMPVFRALALALCKFELHLYFSGKKITNADELQSFSYDRSVSYRCGYSWWDKGKLLVKDLKNWLQLNGFSSNFFETKPVTMPDYMNSDLEQHSYKLAAAVKAWEYFFTHGLTYPKKSLKHNISEWLKDNANKLNLLYKGEVSEQAIEDVAKIVNWKPEGGAPKS